MPSTKHSPSRTRLANAAFDTDMPIWPVTLHDLGVVLTDKGDMPPRHNA